MRRNLSIAILILLVASGCFVRGRRVQNHVDPTDAEMDLFLLIGQSNMQGVAPIGSLDTIPLENVFLFTDKNEWEPARNLPGNGLNRYSTVKKRPQTLFGPAYTFGRKIQQYSGRTIGLVSNARGATRIEWWQKGFQHDSTYRGESDFNLFEEAVERTKAALASNPKARLKGILWHQGEADNAPERCPHYMERLKALVSDLRAAFKNPGLPFIAGEVGTWKGRGANVNPVIRRIQSEIPFTDWVSSEGYTSINLEKNDPHFDNLSQRSFGGRYADKAAILVYGIDPKGATLFNQENFDGRSVLVCPGKYSSTQLEAMGIMPNEVSSMKVDAGYRVLIITKSGKRELTESESILQVSSLNQIVVEKTSAGG